MSISDNRTAFWSSLTHQGVVLSPVVLPEFLDTVCGKNSSLPEPKPWLLRELRTQCTRLDVDPKSHRREFIDWVLTRLLGHGDSLLKRGAGELPSWSRAVTAAGKVLAPDRALRHGNGPALLIQADDAERLGVHRSRRRAAEFVQLLRRTGCPVGLFTNGTQWRLIWAGPDADAWVQWETSAWFGEGEEAPVELRGFLALLGTKSLTAVAGEDLPLHHAVRESRYRQGELSRRLGEQVRCAVEQLLAGLQAQVPADADLGALYQAATRVVMRLVVLFFAESERRGLLPRNEPLYDDSYGVEGLLAQLRNARSDTGAESLAERYGAWNRLLALFKLIHGGADLGGLPIPTYGGELFHPGKPDAKDAIQRELARLEAPDAAVNDLQVLELLEGLKYTELRIGKGRSGRTVPAPVDFGDLSTEYIGILYEGLLDFELRRVGEEEEAVVRLALGREPYLPFRRLREMEPEALQDLFTKLAKDKEKADPIVAGSDADSSKSSDAEEEGRQPTIQERIHKWANQAADAWGKKGITGTRLIPSSSVYLPGQFYLVRWGGTRKGSGTFYTPPALAEPTTRRTLQPLCFHEDGKPRTPQEILALRVCDPACGSGSFLVGALRYLTNAYVDALEACIAADPERPRRFPYAEPTDDPHADDYIKLEDGSLTRDALLRAKRYVAQRCLYGVDLNPLAVELCRVALWVETLAPDLPFEFFSHHVKCGNSLVGAWLDQIEDYPLLAWARKGGTKESTKRLQEVRRKEVKPQMKREVERMLLAEQGQKQGGLFDEVEAPPQRAVVEEAHQALMELQAIPIHDADGREHYWKEEIEGNSHLKDLRTSFDRWCAVWFWPVRAGEDDLLPTPRCWYHQPETLSDGVAKLKHQHRFFHWELEFPEVFCRKERPGFDAVVGNPPWDIQKPNSLEFFSNFDPIYRTYGKQDALGHQKALFERDPSIEQQWEAYEAGFKGMSNWVKAATNPWQDSFSGGKAGKEASVEWERVRSSRESVIPAPHPFRRQGGGDLNLYKLFLEQGYSLCRDQGRLGFVVPSGIYTDKGSTELRDLFLDGSHWDWVFAFENRRKIFDIDSRFKFCPIIVQKGGSTDAIQCAFMRHELGDWERKEPPHILIRKEQIKHFAPGTRSLMEFRSRLDIEICEKIYHNRPLLQDRINDGWQVEFAREFDMTNDSHLFTPRAELERQGLLTPGEDTSQQPTLDRLLEAGWVPLQQGRHTWQWTARYRGDHGYFLREEAICRPVGSSGLTWREVASDTNARTVIAAPVEFLSGHGHKLWTAWFEDGDQRTFTLDWLNSVVFDFIFRIGSQGTGVLKHSMLSMPWWGEDETGKIFDEAPSGVEQAPAWDASLARFFDLSEDEYSHVLHSFPVIIKKDPSWLGGHLKSFKTRILN